MITAVLPEAALPLLEANPVLVQILIAFFSIAAGIVTVCLGIHNYIKQKKIDAMFGFYIHLLVYLEQLQKWLNYPGIKRLFFDKKTQSELTEELGDESAEQYADALRLPFSTFCAEFLRYISTADNNVSPAKKNTPGKWKTWYNNILLITPFLQEGQITSLVSPYTSKDQYAEFETYYQQVQTAIAKLQKSIKKRLKIKTSPSL
jgi:hypothetical protein